MQVELGGGSEPMLRATEVELFDGLAARGLPGRGALGARDDATYDRVYAHCDVLVVGGGPAGPGRRLRRERDRRAGDPRRVGARSCGRARPATAGPCRHAGERLAIAAETRVLLRTTAVGAYDAGYVVLAERRTDHLPGDAAARRRRASGCGTCARGRSCSPPARTSGRSRSRATTSRA